MVRNDKSQAYVNFNFQPQDADHWRDGIPPGGYFDCDENGDVDYSHPVLVNGEPALGIMVVNAPLGTDAYVLEYLTSKQEFILLAYVHIQKCLFVRCYGTCCYSASSSWETTGFVASARTSLSCSHLP